MLSFNDMLKTFASIVASFVVVVFVGFGVVFFFGGGGVNGGCYVLFDFFFFGWKICNVNVL